MAGRSGSGFWPGFFTGVAISVLAAVALAWIYPPLQPPEVDEGVLDAPAAPGAPDPAAAAGAPAVAPLAEPARGPLAQGLPSLPAPAGEAPGGPASDASLVPQPTR